MARNDLAFGLQEVSHPTTTKRTVNHRLLLVFSVPSTMTLDKLRVYLLENLPVLQTLQQEKEGIIFSVIGNSKKESIVDDKYAMAILSFFTSFKIVVNSFWATYHQIRMLESLEDLLLNPHTKFFHLSHGNLCPGSIVRVLKRFALSKKRATFFEKLRVTNNAHDLLEFVNFCEDQKVEGIAEILAKFNISEKYPDRHELENFVQTGRSQESTKADYQQANLSEIRQKKEYFSKLVMGLADDVKTTIKDSHSLEEVATSKKTIQLDFGYILSMAKPARKSPKQLKLEKSLKRATVGVGEETEACNS